METETNNDEQNSSTSSEALPSKSRTKERGRSQITPIDTDINDPENLDYEDIDDNHQIKQQNNPVKKSDDDIKSPLPNQNDEHEVSNNNNQATASDEGELDEADLEDGEIHDPSASKNKNSTADDPNHSSTNTGVPSSPQTKVHCRFFLQGRCHWGPNCKYIHPNNESAKSGVAADGVSSTKNELSPPNSAGISVPSITTGNSWISPQASTATSQFFPPPLLRGQLPAAGLPLAPPTGTESAWERGLRSAKALREQSIRRKQQDKDFNDKKFNLTIRDTLDERETDDNLLNVDRSSSIDYDLDHLSGANYPDQHGFSDRYHPYVYSGSAGNSHFNNNNHNNNNQRMNNNARHKSHSLSSNDHPDRRARHGDDYNESRNDNRNRKEKPSVKDSKSIPKRDEGSSYRRNSSQQQYPAGSHHNNDEQLHSNPYHRRGDEWTDAWDRSRNHGGSTRRSSGGGGGVRGPSYSSSSATSSSSSRSTRSRSHSTSSSSRSRSRSRSRSKRRSPSVTRASKALPTTKSSETVKNGNEKKSNGNKKLVSPAAAAAAAAAVAKKFLPGRQISSHTLKKAEKSSNSGNSVTNSHSKDQRGKDSEKKVKKSTKKENINRSNSTSSSSSSDSDGHRAIHRSSSSSSDSSSSENDTRPSTKTKTASGGSKAATSNSSHSKKPVNRQLSSSSGVGNKDSKSKNDLTTRETSSKKRRDTSSSAGSASVTKKSKINTDSQKSSTDASNAENSDSSKKKETELVKKLRAVDKLVNQRSTKASS